MPVFNFNQLVLSVVWQLVEDWYRLNILVSNVKCALLLFSSVLHGVGLILPVLVKSCLDGYYEYCRVVRPDGYTRACSVAHLKGHIRALNVPI